MSASALTAAQRGFILNVDQRSIEGEEDRQRFLSNLAADQRRIERARQPGRSDAVPRAMCGRCGMLGQHQTAAACIAALRDRLARWE